MDKHKFEVIWNKGAIERCPTRDEEKTFTGTDKEFMEYLDSNYVEVMYDDNDNIVDLDTFVKEYDDYADIDGSTWLKKITKDGKVIFETEYKDEDDDWDEDDLDESKEIKKEWYDFNKCAKCGTPLNDEDGYILEGQHYCDNCYIDETEKITESSKYNEFGLKEKCPKCGGTNITFRDGPEYDDYYEAEAYCNDCKKVIDSTEVNYDDLDENLSLEEATIKALQRGLTESGKYNLNNLTPDMQTELDTCIEEIKEVLNKYVEDIDINKKKVNYVISCIFNTIEIPNKNGEYTGQYYEIPQKTFEQFLKDLKAKGYRQYGPLIWNDWLVMFNTASLTGSVTLGKVFQNFKIMVQIKVKSIESGKVDIFINIK